MTETPTPLDLEAITARSDARRDYADERSESLHDPEGYAALADESAADVPALVAEVERLRAEVAGRDLACWCPLDSPCHADVLLELANPKEQP